MRKQYHIRTSERGNLIWDVDRLLELSNDLSRQQVPLSDIRELDEEYWFGSEEDRATVRAVADHARLTAETDLSYPIILCADGRVMDGGRVQELASRLLDSQRFLLIAAKFIRSAVQFLRML